MKSLSYILLVLFIIFASGFLGSMDAKIIQRETEWQESVQAFQMEQEAIQDRIIILQTKQNELKDMYINQGILINNIYEKMHFDLFDYLDELQN